jgi:hypothetical protein
MVMSITADRLVCGPETELTYLSMDQVQIETSSSGGAVVLDTSVNAPDIWLAYEYLTAEVYHESHDVLVIVFTLTEADGRSISIHYGTLPKVRTRLCLPLHVLSGDKLFLDRYPGVLQSVLRGDAAVDRGRIVSLTISTIPSVSPRRFSLSNLQLRQFAPEFQYDYTPYIDKLGQLAGKDWLGKTRTSDDWKQDLDQELHLARMLAANEFTDTGKYGGWKKLRFTPSGYYRTEYEGTRWWFVDPEGYAMFSTGIDCIGPYDTMRVTGMEHLIPDLPDKNGAYRHAWSKEGFSFAVANLIRVFGEKWRECWAELTELRLKEWGINTIGNWSQNEFIAASSLSYVYPMEDFPTTMEKIFRDFPDVFAPEYEENAKGFAGQLIPLREDRRLVGYFMRNEPHWAFVDGLNLTELMLKHPAALASKDRFVGWLEERYGTVSNWNTVWRTSYETFRDVLDPAKLNMNGTQGQQEDFAAYNRLMIRRYVEVPARHCKEADPHHLNLGMRYAWVASDDILEGCEAFDVFSINCYQFKPDKELIEKISKKLQKPVMIGEFHFGAVDVGMLAYGIRAVATQEDRGLAYRYYVEQAAAIPELIGVHYFQLNDQPVLGRFDGENYQIGLVDVCQRPYSAIINQMKLAHEHMYGIRTGHILPLYQPPAEIPKTGF